MPKDDDDYGDDDDDVEIENDCRWGPRKNPAVLAGAEYIANDEESFVPPYWIGQYMAEDMSMHLGLIVTLTAGVAMRTTDNIVLSLEKEQKELVITMKLDDFYTEMAMLETDWFEERFGKRETGAFNGALEKKMSFMHASKQDPFIFMARILLGLAVNPLIDEDDWHLQGDRQGNCCLIIVLKTPTPGTYKGKGHKKIVDLLGF